MAQIKAGMTVHEAILVLARKGLKRHLNMNILGNIAGIIVGPGFILLGLILKQYTQSNVSKLWWVAVILGGICSVILVVAAVQLIIQIRSNKKVLADLADGYKKLVWIYVESRTGETVGIPVKGSISIGPFFHVYFFLNDGTATKGWFSTADMINLFNMVERFVTDIHLGWDRSLYQKWKKDPAMADEPLVRNRHMKPYVFRTTV